MHKYHCIIVWILLLKSFLNPAYGAILVSSHTAHCAQNVDSANLRMGSASVERVVQEEVGVVTCRVLCHGNC